MESFQLKIYDKRAYFDFNIVNFPHLDGDVPRAPSYGVYISQLIRFARACSFIEDFNIRNRSLTEKLLKQGYRYHKLRKTFSKFYHRNLWLINKYKCTLKGLLRQISHPEFYVDVIYKLRKIIGHTHFQNIFVKCIKRFIKKGIWSTCSATYCMSGCQPFYSWQSRCPLCAHDDS